MSLKPRRSTREGQEGQGGQDCQNIKQTSISRLLKMSGASRKSGTRSSTCSMEQVKEVGREPEIVQRQTEFSNNLEV